MPRDRDSFDQFYNIVKNQPDGLSKVLAIGKAYHQFSLDFPNYFHAMSRFEKFEIEEIKQVLNEPIVQEAHKAGEAVLTVLANAVQGGIDDGTIRKDVDPMSTAISLWAISNGVILMHNYRGEHLRLTNGIEPDFLLEYFYDFTNRALRK